MAFPIFSKHYHAFEPQVHVDTGEVESYNTIDVKGGVWYEETTSTVFADVSNIGSDVNRFILADLDTGTIYANPTIPAAGDNRRRLLITLIYATYVVGATEQPPSPSYEGEEVIVNWVRHQLGDIYPSSASIDHDFKISATIGDYRFNVNGGYWERNGYAPYCAAWTLYDPLSDIVDVLYDGNIYVYAILRADTDSPTSCELIASVNPLIPGGYNSDFNDLLYIGSVAYTAGEITGFTQHQIGSHKDTLSLYSRDFGIKLTRSSVDGFPTINVRGGILSVNANASSVGGYTGVPIDYDTAIWLEIGDPVSASRDPSLKPFSPQILSDLAFPAEVGFTRLFKQLYTVHVTEIARDTMATMYYCRVTIVALHVGMVKDSWVRPDGRDSGIGDVDSAQCGQTLNFVTAAENATHEGELQDFKFFGEVINNESTRYGTDGDQGMSYFIWDAAADVIKKYLRVDSVNATAHGVGQSLEVKMDGTDAYLQVYGYKLGEPFVAITDPIDLAAASALDGFAILARDKVAPYEMSYLGLRNFKPDTCGTADYATNAGHSDSIDCDDVETCINCTFLEGLDCDFPKAHSELTDIVATIAGDDHNGTLSTGNYPYIANRGDFARNQMTSGLGDSGLLESVNVNGRFLTATTGKHSVNWESGLLNLPSDDTVSTVDWATGKLNDTSELLSVDWVGRFLQDEGGFKVLSYTDGDQYIQFDTFGTNIWDPLDDIQMQNVGTGTLLFGNNLTVEVGAFSGSAITDWKNYGNMYIYPDGDDRHTFRLGNSGDSVRWKHISQKAKETWTADADDLYLGKLATAGNIHYRDIQGQTITDWFEAGGFIKTGAEEITITTLVNGDERQVKLIGELV